MPKYYISSGSMNVIIQGANESDAILSALNFCIEKNGLDIDLEPHFYVSEKGFRSDDAIQMTSSDVLSGLDFDFGDE